MTTTTEAQAHLRARRGLSRELASRRLSRGVLYLVIWALSAIFLTPFFWTVSSSLKAPIELYTFPPSWLPAAPRWENYVHVWRYVPFGKWLVNSLLVTLLSTAGAILSACIVAYSFARFKYPGREVLFLITLSTMMLPVEVTLIPTYLLFNKVGWIDTLKPLWVPSWFGGGAFNIFILRQFFMTIPRDLDDAAKMDGANTFRILWTIIVPLSKPALATIAVISFVGHWNEFLGPLVYLNSVTKFTVAVGLRYFQASPGGEGGMPTEHLLMAASVMVAAPCILLFFVAQKYFVRGIVMSGIKG